MQARRMTATNEYRGITYSIANNDDGVWRWIVYPKKLRRSEIRNDPPRPTYATRKAAVQAAKEAIDRSLDDKPAKKIAADSLTNQSGDSRPRKT